MDLKKFHGSPKIILSKELVEQINHHHAYIGRDEWCGILLWKIVEGNLDNPDDLVIKCVDMFLMDVGSSSYTEFETDAESIIALANQFPEYEDGDLISGFIHTHHHMKTFFSGTDQSELKDNTTAFSAYLSLIVNFAMDNTARLAFKVKQETEKKYSIADMFGRFFNLSDKQEEEFIGYYDCEIEYEEKNQTWYTQRAEKLLEEKTAKASSAKRIGYAQPYSNRTPNNQGNWLNANRKTSTPIPLIDINSFICKCIALNPTYVGSDVNTCINRMNSKILSDRPNNDKTKNEYREAIEDVFEEGLKKAMSKPGYNNHRGFIYETAMERLSKLENYMVAEVLLDIITDEYTDQPDDWTEDSLEQQIMEASHGYFL